jgi:NodT family efflux transporter outer membrane factor (OMF) lipoprotein
MTSPRTPVFAELGDSTLDELIAEARHANTDVHMAEARLIGARASRRLATLDLVPSVTAVGSTIRQQQSVALVPGLTRQLPQQQLWDVGFDASWEVDLFGRVARSVRARQALVASSEYDLEDVRVSITAEVARTYFELRGAQQQLAVSLRNADNQRRIVKLTEDRLAAGRGTAFDTERAHSILSLTLASIPGIEAQIWTHRYRLATLLGRSPDGLPGSVLEARPLPRLPDTLNVRSADHLVQRRPDVMRAERQLAAQTLAVGAARTEYLPRLTLGARAGYVATSFDSLSRAGTSRLFAGPVISFPLLDLGRVRQRVGVAEAFKKEAEAEHRATMLRALEENESALIAYDRAHARLAILEDAVQSSMRAAVLAQQRFEAGLTDFFQVLDAQRTQLDAENQLALGHTAAATALVAVYKSVGGAWPLK